MVNSIADWSDWLGPRDQVVQRVRSETGYDTVRAGAIADQLGRLHPLLRGDLLMWWDFGVVKEDMDFHGYSVARLIEAGHCRYVVEAFVQLALLLREPTAMLARLQTSELLHVTQPDTKEES